MDIKIKDLRRVETELEQELDIQKDRVKAIDILTVKAKSLDLAAAEGQKAQQAQLEKVSTMIAMKFKIRQIVSGFNKDKGINDRTLKIAVLSEKLDVCQQAQTARGPSANHDWSSDKIDGYNCGITVAMKDELRIQERGIRQQIQKLKDSCNGINSNESVTLPEELVAFLKGQKFIE